MVDIMTELHKYVPTKCYQTNHTTDTGEVVSVPQERVHPILFGGDQLTACRARGAKKAKLNSFDLSSRLDGLIPQAEDWHTCLNFIEV